MTALPTCVLWGDPPSLHWPQLRQPFREGSQPQRRQRSPGCPACSRTVSRTLSWTLSPRQPPMPRSALSVISFCHRLGKQERKQSFMGNSSNSWSHAPFPKLDLGLGSRPVAPREPPACSICLERPREPISLDCGHDFCPRCFSTHRVPGCGPPCCPECRKTCKQKGLRGLGERMRLLPRRPLPTALQTCAVRAQPLLLVRVNASGGLILRMGAVNRCLKHPLARDTPVCLLAVLGERHSGKTFLLNHLLQGLPGLEPGEGGWPREGCSGQGFRWGANSLTRGLWMWSHPFLLGKEGRKVAVFLVDTGDAMSPELSRETRTRLCALTSMLSSYQILTAFQELKDTDLEYLEMFVHVAEVMGRHYGMVPIQVRYPFLDLSPQTPTPRLLLSAPLLFQHLDLLVRDSSHPSKAGQGHVGDIIKKSSGKYPKVQGLLQGRQARCCLLPAPRRRWASKCHGSPGDTDDDAGHLRAYVADVLSAAPLHAKSRCQGYWSEGRPAARGDRRLLTGQQLAQEIKNLSGWMGRTGPGCASPDEVWGYGEDAGGRRAGLPEMERGARQRPAGERREAAGFCRGQMAAQLHDLRTVEAAKKEFEEYLRQQDVATKRIFSALRVLPDTMRNLLSTQKDALLARHGAALLCTGREQTLEALEAELQAEAKAFMDSYTVRFCGHLAAVGGAVGAGLMGLAGGVVGAGMAAAALAAEAGMVAAGAAVGATGAAVVGGGVGAGLAATVGCMEREEDERVQEGDRAPLLQEE
ncbi:RING finger protein 112 isoform X2 [Orcinus orca]|uniref:RING finger protein 112 isoform X2 n=1 Tax=Orcinus orca TaxID=9733 RepID=UPI002111705A|nr:RING finger protein 112 isoform X2 [Orcinus orca]